MSYTYFDICMHTCMLSLQSWPALCHPMDHSPPVSSVRGILQARILEQVATLCPSPWDLPDPGIKPVSPVAPALAGRFFTAEPSGKILEAPQSPINRVLHWGLSGEDYTCNSEDSSLILGSERSPGGGICNPLQSSSLTNLRKRGDWWATVCGVMKESDTT